jgi:hypothetical protein
VAHPDASAGTYAAAQYMESYSERITEWLDRVLGDVTILKVLSPHLNDEALDKKVTLLQRRTNDDFELAHHQDTDQSSPADSYRESNSQHGLAHQHISKEQSLEFRAYVVQQDAIQSKRWESYRADWHEADALKQTILSRARELQEQDERALSGQVG